MHCLIIILLQNPKYGKGGEGGEVRGVPIDTELLASSSKCLHLI